MRKSYRIIGMHCGACVTKITSALEHVISSVKVSLEPPKAVLEGDSLPTLDSLNKTIAEAGNYQLVDDESVTLQETPQNWFVTYYPLLLIIGLISIVSIAGSASWHDWMLHFMSGFFIVFSFFKLLDLNGFSDAYATYDLLAKRWRGYGFIYPFLELGLGLLFLFQFELHLALYGSIVLMGFSSLGVVQALMEQRKIRCACLGTVLNLPMSTITLVEDLGMIVMSIMMLRII